LQVTYFNTLLFPLIAIRRIMNQLLGKQSDSDDRLPPAPLNHLLERIFAIESLFIGRLRMPFGVSLLAIAERS
jgi:hypothetical protein